jgi:hypothetical protein
VADICEPILKKSVKFDDPLIMMVNQKDEHEWKYLNAFGSSAKYLPTGEQSKLELT